MIRLAVLVLAIALVTAGCSSSTEAESSTGAAVTTAVTTSTTFPDAGECDTATSNTIDAFDAIFDSIEADEAAITDHVRAVVDLTREFDAGIVSQCEPNEIGDALVEFSDWMRTQASTRGVSVRTLIAGFLHDIELEQAG